MIAAPDQPDTEAVVDGFPDHEADAPEAAIIYAEPASDRDEREAKRKKKGKGSRWNAVRHGCMAKLLVPADLEAEVARWTAMLTEHHRPTSDYESGIIAQLGRLAAQLERNQKMKVVDLQRTMDRAVLCWNEDRLKYINQLAAKLRTVPGVAKALGETKQGAEWLLGTWKSLAVVLEEHGKWDEEEHSLAMDLIDVRAELRNSYLKMTREEDTETLLTFVREEMARIEKTLEEYLYAVDDAERWMAAAGMPPEEDAETKRLRKQEGRIKLDYRRTLGGLLESRAQAAAVAAGAAQSPPPEPPPEPVVAAVRPKPDQKPAPTPRPTTSNAAHKYLVQRSTIDALDVPETATSPAQRVEVRFPFPGGDAPAELAAESEPAFEAEAEDDVDAETVVVAEPAADRPQTGRVASNSSRAVVTERRDRDRKSRRDQEKKARKAARRNRR